MPKGSIELTNARKNEIIDACKELYKTMSFKEITIKEIGTATSFTRTSIYNYFQTKEEIFLALLQREYEAWNNDLLLSLDKDHSISKLEFAKTLALTISKRELLLKILSMNLFDIEENSRIEKLVEFKCEYGKSLLIIEKCLKKVVPAMNDKEINEFIYSFFPFVYGIYPYTHITEKQQAAMKTANIDYKVTTVYDITLMYTKKIFKI